MMEELARIALVGTARRAAPPAAEVDHPAESLVAALPGPDRERSLLLRAGVRAVFEQCGREAITGVTAPRPAPEESRPVASPRLAALLQSAMAPDARDVLIEFLSHLERVGLLLPHELLPQALAIGEAAVRERLRPVLGERGRWLSGFHADWHWAVDGVNDLAPRDREALDRLWSEGDLGERRRVLQTLRRADPARARELLATGIDKDKPEHRARLLEMLAEGLCAEDEPLLESRLDDRSEQVRVAAASLLARLPGSALALRMRGRAETTLLAADPNARGKRLRLNCRPPEEIDKTWVRDGIPAKAPSGQGKRAVWTEAVLSLVPPSYWCDRFSATPQELLEAASADDFAPSVLAGWTRAAAAMAPGDPATAAWLRPLWDHWAVAVRRASRTDLPRLMEHLRGLLRAMRPSGAEESLLPLLGQIPSQDHGILLELLNELPRPWGAGFGQEILALARRMLKQRTNYMAYFWARSLPTAAEALARESLASVSNEWDLTPAGAAQEPSYGQIACREIERFIETVRLRRSFYEEVATNITTQDGPAGSCSPPIE